MDENARPLPPALGDPLPVHPSRETLDLLAHRRSSPAQALGEPGPDREQLSILLRLGARVPDHGKLAPWRFILIARADKPALLTTLQEIAATRAEPDIAQAKLGKLAAAPMTIGVVSRADPASKIPVWEQELSAGAVCMNLLIAAEAMGFGANWITDWYAYEPAALRVLGLGPHEKLAGFVHVGTPAEPPLERARPDIADLVTSWSDRAQP